MNSLKILSGLFFCLIATCAYSKDYLFAGIYQKNSSTCSDYGLVTEEFDTRDEAILYKNDFFKNASYFNKAAELFTPEQAGLIYQYQRRSPGFDCVMTAFGAIKGPTIEEAAARLAKHAAEYKKYFLSEPTITRRWEGGGYRNRFTRNYDGLEITYTAYRKVSGKTTVHAKIRNTRTDKPAQIVFGINGRPGGKGTIFLPGEEGNYNLGEAVNEFDAAVRFVASQGGGKDIDNSFIDSAKDFVREQVTIKDGKMKAKSSAIGGSRG